MNATMAVKANFLGFLCSRHSLRAATARKVRIPAKSATHSDFGRTLIPVSSDTYRSEATLAV